MNSENRIQAINAEINKLRGKVEMLREKRESVESTSLELYDTVDIAELEEIKKHSSNQKDTYAAKINKLLEKCEKLLGMRTNHLPNIGTSRRDTITTTRRTRNANKTH